MNGKIVSISGNSLSVKQDDGNSVSRTVAAGATITLNGKNVPLSDLKAGDTVGFNGDPANNVTATR